MYNKVVGSNILNYPIQGLLGLGITNTELNTTDIEYIIELLNPNNITTNSTTNTTTNTTIKSSKSERGTKTDPIPIESLTTTSSISTDSINRTTARGIRYLDLSDNSLGATDCSAIIRSSLKSTLEALDISGSEICSKCSSVFIDSLSSLGPSSSSTLKHLGIPSSSSTTTTTTTTTTTILTC